MNKNLIIFLTVIILAVVGIVVVKSNSSNPSSENTTSQGAKDLGVVPDFTLQDFEGNTVSLSDFAGKPLVINSWAAWCPFCRDELIAFASIQKELGDQIATIAIDRAESLDVARSFPEKLGITDDLVFLLDPDDSFYKAIGGFAMPETIFVDADGSIVEHKRGPMDEKEIREKIKSIL